MQKTNKCHNVAAIVIEIKQLVNKILKFAKFGVVIDI